jgi:hypothetical protein
VSRRGIASVLISLALLLHFIGLKARDEAWYERATWPIQIETVVAPQAAKMTVGLFGRELTADLLWIRTLVYAGSGIAQTGAFVHLDQLIRAVMTADPKFQAIYKFAAYEITHRNERATQEEFLLSVGYVEKGIKEFPDNYELFWIGGLRYYMDMWSEDPAQRRRWKERGAELIEEAMRKPDAPPGLATFAATLRTKLGQTEHAKRDLIEMIRMTENPSEREKLVARLRHLAADEADAVLDAAVSFERQHKSVLPHSPAGVFVLLGPAPSPKLDLGELAAGPDFFSELADEAAR